MSTIRKLLDNKYAAWLKNFIISLFTRYDFTLADMVVFVIVCTSQSWWWFAFYVIWIFIISPSIVADKEHLDKDDAKEYDEHTQL